MKFLINKISKFYICKVTIDDYVYDIDVYEIIETNVNINTNLLINKWNGSSWIEGATQQEIEEQNQKKVSDKTLEIYNEYEKLYTSSLARAVSKVGQGLTREHLNNLREEYNDVKLLAEAYLNDGTILNQKAFQDITDEMELDFPGEVLDNTIDYLNTTYNGNPNYVIIPNLPVTPRIIKFCWLIVNKYNLGEAMWTYLKDLCSKF